MTRLGYVMSTYFATLFIGISALFTHVPRLLWNASASTPVGLYALRPPRNLKLGELVADLPPPALSRYMAVRYYLPLGVPLLKSIGALAGQTVCRRDLVIFVDGHAVATARIRDHAHRPLPVWQGCRVLGPDEIFLLNPAIPDSFDGRYFGPLPLSTVTARATTLWTERAP